MSARLKMEATAGSLGRREYCIFKCVSGRALLMYTKVAPL